jgi:rod shape-determining protein MreD
VRSLVVFAVSGILAVALQTALLQQLRFLPAAPDLIVVLTVYLALHYHTAAGALGAFLLGYLLDAFSGSPPGLYCLAMTSVFTMVYLLSKRLWMENPVTNLAAVALGCAAKSFVVIAFFALANPGTGTWGTLLQTLGLEAVLALLVAPLVFSTLDTYLAPVWKARSRAHEAQ